MAVSVPKKPQTPKLAVPLRDVAREHRRARRDADLLALRRLEVLEHG